MEMEDRITRSPQSGLCSSGTLIWGAKGKIDIIKTVEVANMSNVLVHMISRLSIPFSVAKKTMPAELPVPRVRIPVNTMLKMANMAIMP